MKIVMLNCGKFDYAEVELDVPVHLIGPNNVGKTSLISLLQFLYLDDQRKMQFSRDMGETRRYYFPGKHSYALFECLTPTGFQVVGVHGLGPVKQYAFERFVYTGRIDIADFLDAERVIREPESSLARLANKGFKRLTPKELRAALTGSGDARGVSLGLVPTLQKSGYQRFRKVFGNILRLSHIRQDELKQLLLDIFSNDFQQRQVDLEQQYASGFQQVRRDAQDVKALKSIQGDIQRLLSHLEHRNSARSVIPALWQAVGESFLEQKAGLDDQAEVLLEERQKNELKQAELKRQRDAAHEALRELSGDIAILKKNLSDVEEDRRRFSGFQLEWARQRRETVKKEQIRLAVLLRDAQEAPVEQIRKRLDTAKRELTRKRRQLENLAQAAVNLLRNTMEEREIVDAFTVLNPDLLQLPVNTEKPGVKVTDQATPALLARELLKGVEERTLRINGVEIDLEALRAPHLSEYDDPERIQSEIEALGRDVQHYSEALAGAEKIEAPRSELKTLDRELESLIKEINAYERFRGQLDQEEAWKAELERRQGREQTLQAEVVENDRQLDELLKAGQRHQRAQDEVEQRRKELLSDRSSLSAPAGEWPFQPIENLTADWSELRERYRKAFNEEQREAQQVSEVLSRIDEHTYGRYTDSDEAVTIERLRNELESIPERERAVEELWKGIAVGIKKELQSIGKDFQTLKGLVSTLNRNLSKINISNLTSLKLLVVEQPHWVNLIKSVTIDEELPLFSNPQAAEEALREIGRLLADHPRVDLKDFFNLSFEVGTPDGKSYRHAHLDAIESNGTTMAIKVMVNLTLLRRLLGTEAAQIPFYLDECSSLDQTNLAALVNVAREMGFIAVLASPEAMDAADKLYYLNEHQGGRVIVDPQTALVHVRRSADQYEEVDADQRQVDADQREGSSDA